MVTKPVKGSAGWVFHPWPESQVTLISMWWVKSDAQLDFWSLLSPSCPTQESAHSPSQALAPGVSVIKVCLREELSGPAMGPLLWKPSTSQVLSHASLRDGVRVCDGLFVLQVILLLLPHLIRYYHDLGRKNEVCQALHVNSPSSEGLATISELYHWPHSLFLN